MNGATLFSRTAVFVVDGNRNGVELLDHVAYGKVIQVSQASLLLKVKDSVIGQYSLDGSLVKGKVKDISDLLRDGVGISHS